MSSSPNFVDDELILRTVSSAKMVRRAAGRQDPDLSTPPRMAALEINEHDLPDMGVSPVQQDMSLATSDISLSLVSTPKEESQSENREDVAEDGDEEERRRREEEESIELARALMAEEAMAVSYHMSHDYLRYNRDQFSEEDFAALQAAMEEEEEEQVVEGDQEDGGMSYELMLRLGEQMGDVKSERWSRVAREKIACLPTFKYDPSKTIDKDENDCEVKCMVCQFSYETKESLRRLPCGHCFHTECVDQWLMAKDFCPYCRQAIVDEE
jgi:hypothetical protein